MLSGDRHGPGRYPRGCRTPNETLDRAIGGCSATLRLMPDEAPTAEKVAQQLGERNASAAALGIELVDIGIGRATVAMTVRSDMANGLGVCHGGVIFTLSLRFSIYGWHRCPSWSHSP